MILGAPGGDGRVMEIVTSFSAQLFKFDDDERVSKSRESFESGTR
jgi:hypothetical protein